MLRGLSPRSVPVDSNGMVVIIISWMLLALTVFTLLVRYAMKLILSKRALKFSCDDVAIFLAALFSIGQTIATCTVASQVLGRHAQELTLGQLDDFQKTQYAFIVLYIANLGTGRISLCLFIRDIIAGTKRQRIALGMGALNLLWTIATALAATFPCKAPHVWQYVTRQGKMRDDCINCVAFTNFVAASNIVLDCLIILFPLVYWNVSVSMTRMMAIFFAFASRFAVIACIIPGVVFFNRYQSDPDFTYHWWRLVLPLQIAQNLSVMTACIPCFSPFLLSLQCNKRRPADLRIRRYRDKEEKNFDSLQSSSSTSPLRTSHYVAPLATYGLTDRDSMPRDYFNRRIDYPRPFTASSQQSQSQPQSPNPQEPPKALAQVGILPTIEWETDSDKPPSTGGRSTPGPRHPDSDYVFNREKVISVPEATKLYEGKGAEQQCFHHKKDNSWS